MFEKIIGKLVICLLKYLNTYNQYVKNKYFRAECKYQFLIPNEKAEHINEYSKALDEALNEKKVKNIAITGSYGSGKSSFIKTFEKNNENSIYEFLDISLARFNKKDKTSTINSSLIEKSILEQMFYKVKSGNFGDYKHVGDRVYELRIKTGPGYRIYYTMRDEVVVILLIGGDKSSQNDDIAKAKEQAKELPHD